MLSLTRGECERREHSTSVLTLYLYVQKKLNLLFGVTISGVTISGGTIFGVTVFGTFGVTVFGILEIPLYFI